ncbi:hypothetical protein H6G80_31635 [Nostoc sp. FACHB-87]|uniref:hypothetical protein n=1 Tax=Nostocales TaxID=1161 RepID=UPI0016837D88|nr:MULTISPECIES: hypothetical protein [Nostocales]MBD2299865.1 hypothetical protein [Nostoc sp. FACHB-190]MBD2458603.1 hypothetical protein [Nostoc sp. FACHB-87]MBD2479745.1 hypothetical protein [Anabaena sp. FACHB-83]MBD2490055.1 hypothetical protein [Aulosira sp. FACHB-615]
MNPQPEEDWQQRLQKLEAEINAESVEAKKTAARQQSRSYFLNFKQYFTRSQLWFQSLSGTGKLVVMGVTVLMGLAVLQAVLKLVTSAISLAVLAGLVYLGYKFFVADSFSNKP